MTDAVELRCQDSDQHHKQRSSGAVALNVLLLVVLLVCVHILLLHQIYINLQVFSQHLVKRAFLEWWQFKHSRWVVVL